MTVTLGNTSIQRFLCLLKRGALACISLLLLSNVVLATSDDKLPDQVWISFDLQTLAHLNEYHPDLLISEAAHRKSTGLTEIYVAQINKQDLSKLSGIMHEQFHRCGGFFTHTSEKAALESLATRTKSQANVSYEIDNPDAVSALIDRLSVSRMENVVEQFGSYYSRYYESDTGIQASQWLRGQWVGISESRSDISVDYYEHGDWPQPSVMATITGATLPEEYVIIGGHLDSINRIQPATNIAPGMDDNATGIAVITALLEMIVDSDFYPSRTVVLIGYAAEEVGLLGSGEIADNFKRNNRNVIGAAQFDMTGYFGTPAEDIVFISDFTDAEQNDFMAALIDEYHPDITYGFDVCGYACSDHASWHREGFRASFPFEARFNDANPRIHTNTDTFYDVTHMSKFARLAATYVAELAKGDTGIENINDSIGFGSSSIEVNAGNTVSLTVSRSGLNSGQVSVNYSTIDGSAFAGTHYTSASGQLIWEANDQTPKTIQVATQTTTSDRHFTVELSSPSDGAIIDSTNRIQVTIKSAGQPTPLPGETPSSGGGGSTAPVFILGLILTLLLRSRKTMP